MIIFLFSLIFPHFDPDPISVKYTRFARSLFLWEKILNLYQSLENLLVDFSFVETVSFVAQSRSKEMSSALSETFSNALSIATVLHQPGNCFFKKCPLFLFL